MSDAYNLDEGPDPATFAAAEPESGSLADPVYAVGIGPGNTEYLIPRGKRAIREAEVVVGFTTVVDFVADATDADLLRCGYEDELETLSQFAERVDAGARGTAVLMGDPNHSGYQFVGKVERAVEGPVRIIPGISSIQVAASRARTPLEETTFVTLHKSGEIAAELDTLGAAVGNRPLLVLPRPYDWMPGDIAEFLLEKGAHTDLEALVLEHLTHDNESIHRSSLGALASHAGGDSPSETPFSDISILAVRTDRTSTIDGNGPP